MKTEEERQRLVLKEIERWRRKNYRGRRVYFVKNDDENYVKIGSASIPEMRVKGIRWQLRCHRGWDVTPDLQLLTHVPGDYELEAVLHREYRHLRACRYYAKYPTGRQPLFAMEWFYYAGEIERLVHRILQH